MAIKVDDSEVSGELAPYPIRCVTCHKDLRAAGWKSGPVEHCRGGQNTFGCWKQTDHHGHRYVYCKSCQRMLGCDICLLKDPLAYVCTICDVFGDGTPVRSDEQRARVSELAKSFYARLDARPRQLQEGRNG